MSMICEAVGELERLQDRFAHWRQQNWPVRPSGFLLIYGMRHRFWRDIMGFFKVARSLRLDYATIKERTVTIPHHRHKQKSATFVELMMPSPMAALESVIELTNC